MDRKQYELYLFLRKVEEVRERMRSGDLYHMVMATGLLRHLLLDKLVHVANQHYRLKLKFDVGKECIYDDPGAWLQFSGLEPDNDAPITVNLDGLLSRKMIQSFGKTFTVKDILKSCANARGGVHFDELSGDDELLFAADTFIGFGLPTTFMALRAIAAVALKGLQPLIDLAQDEFKPGSVVQSIVFNSNMVSESPIEGIDYDKTVNWIRHEVAPDQPSSS